MLSALLNFVLLACACAYRAQMTATEATSKKQEFVSNVDADEKDTSVTNTDVNDTTVDGISGGFCTGGMLCKNLALSECANSAHSCGWDGSGGTICTGGMLCKGLSQSKCVNSVHSCDWKTWPSSGKTVKTVKTVSSASGGFCIGGMLCRDLQLSECANSPHSCGWKGSGSTICTGGMLCKGLSQSSCVNSVHSCHWKHWPSIEKSIEKSSAERTKALSILLCALSLVGAW